MDSPRKSVEDMDVHYVRGFPFPAGEVFPLKNIESALDYKPQNGDVFITSYPKSGTTWVLYITHHILHGTEVPLPYMDETERIMPFMDCVGAEAHMSLNSPIVMKYHLPYRLIPKSPLAKYISIIRNPYDTLVSYFYFLRNIYSEGLQLDKFVDDFILNKVPYGNYFDNVLSWLQRENDPNVLLLSYDKMSLDPRKGLLKIAKFLGDEYFNHLNKDEALVTKILERTSFAFMKKRLSVDKSENKPARKTQSGLDPATFFRKGAVGGYKYHLSQEQTEKIKTWITENSAGTEVGKFWRI